LQAFGRLGDEFQPLLTGCLNNRRHWLALAEGKDLEDEEPNDESAAAAATTAASAAAAAEAT
jgi:hypothetical protein